MNNISKEFDDLLDSDDEFPSSYEETEDIPAYLNDNRFDEIFEKHKKSHEVIELHSKTFNEETSKNNALQPKKTNYEILNEEMKLKMSKMKVGDKSLVVKAVLSQQDIICIQSIEEFTSDAVMLWFINYLAFKDMHSGFKFLKSCLVSTSSTPFRYHKESLSSADMKKNFNFTIELCK